MVTKVAFQPELLLKCCLLLHVFFVMCHVMIRNVAFQPGMLLKCCLLLHVYTSIFIEYDFGQQISPWVLLNVCFNVCHAQANVCYKSVAYKKCEYEDIFGPVLNSNIGYTQVTHRLHIKSVSYH